MTAQPEARYWSLDATVAWILNRRHAPTGAVVEHSANGRSGFMLLHVRQGLAKANAQVSEDQRPMKGDWWEVVAGELREAGLAGHLENAVFDRDTDAPQNFSREQWARMDTLPLSGKRRLGLTDGSRVFDIRFDASRTQKIWPGKRGPRNAVETVMDGSAFRLNERDRKLALEEKILQTISSGTVPSDPTAWLEEARGTVIGPETAREIRSKAIRRAKEDGLPAAEAWGRRGRKPGRKNR